MRSRITCAYHFEHTWKCGLLRWDKSPNRSGNILKLPANPIFRSAIFRCCEVDSLEKIHYLTEKWSPGSRVARYPVSIFNLDWRKKYDFSSEVHNKFLSRIFLYGRTRITELILQRDVIVIRSNGAEAVVDSINLADFWNVKVPPSLSLIYIIKTDPLREK